jgi:hypothetical protein
MFSSRFVANFAQNVECSNWTIDLRALRRMVSGIKLFFVTLDVQVRNLR